jgi:hypothetical protein
MNPKTVVKMRRRASEKGSALVYILIAIALLAVLTVSFMEPSSQQTSSQNTFKTVSALQGQIDSIRSAIQGCVLLYPQGDKCIEDDTPAYCTTTATDTPGANKRYPLNPDSDHFANATPGPAADRLVRNMRCPGDNGGENANHDNHALIFTGASGKFLEPPPDLFEEWQIYNGTDGVFYWTRTSKTDAFISAALEKLDEKFQECEADIIDATGGAVDMDSDVTTQATCPAGEICFRVWVINNATAPHGDYAIDNSCGSSDI